MYTYYVQPYPYEAVLRYQKGSFSVATDYNGIPLDIPSFIDLLITEERMDYFGECIPLLNRMEYFLEEFEVLHT